MTVSTAWPEALVEGPIDSERWGSIGFKVDDPTAARQVRKTARWLVERWKLTWVKDFADDVELIVSELVTNVQKHASEPYHSASVTLWHPKTRFIISVHDKGPLMPYRNLRQCAPASSESGRGLWLARQAAERHCGELDMVRDGDREMPGKVIQANMLMPNVIWSFKVRDPWSRRML